MNFPKTIAAPLLVRIILSQLTILDSRLSFIRAPNESKPYFRPMGTPGMGGYQQPVINRPTEMAYT